MSSPFKKASRTQAKARVALAGPAKAGKSFTSLRLAFALAHANGGKGRVAAIDTEHGSLAKYVGEKPDDFPFEFDVIELTNYGPIKYVQMIEAAAKEGYDALVIDSLSHAWEGAGGVMDMIDAKGGKWSAWKDVTPQHRTMVDAILAAPLHIICTMRVKTDWIVEEETRNGKTTSTPKKVGMATVQRAGMDYEFDLLGRLDNEHVLRVEGSRCAALDGKVVTKPDAHFFAPFIEWLGVGRPQEPEPKFEPAKKVEAEKEPKATTKVKSKAKEQSPAETTPVAETPTPATTPAPSTEEKPISKVRLSKLQRLKSYKDMLGMTGEQWSAALKKRGVTTAKDLDDAALDEFMLKLQTLVTAKDLLGKNPQPSTNGTGHDKSDPAGSGAAYDDKANLMSNGKPY